MNRGRPKLSSGIGGRSGKNVLLNKNIRKLPDGFDNFDDYFTDKSDDSTNTTISRSSVWRSPSVSTRSASRLDNDKTFSANIQGVTNSSLSKIQSPRKLFGSRSSKNVVPSKNIKKLADGTDDFNDYFANNESNETSSSPADSLHLQSSQISTKNKSYSKNSPSVAISSPITRLSSSKLSNLGEIQSGTNSDEEIPPLINNTNAKKIKKKIGSAEKSRQERHDSCDAKLLKLAEDNEKSENLSVYDSQLNLTKKAKPNLTKSFEMSPRKFSKSPTKKKVSNVGPEDHQHLTRSSNKTLTKSLSVNSKNSNLKSNDKNKSLNKHNHQKNISKDKEYDSNASGSQLKGINSQDSHFDVNTAEDSEDSSEDNDVAEQECTSWKEESTRKFPVKRKFNKINAEQKQKKSNAKFHIDSPKSSFSNVENPRETNRKRLKTPTKNQSKNMDDMLVRTTDRNILTKRKTFSPNTSNFNELQRNGSAQSHFNVNSAQDSEEYSEEDDVAKGERTSYRNEEVTRKFPLKRNSSKINAELNQRKSKATFLVDSPESSLSNVENSRKTNINRRKTLTKNQSKNVDDRLVRTTDKNISTKKKTHAPNTSNFIEHQRNKSVQSHFDGNTAQDFEESLEENGVEEGECTSYGNEEATRKFPEKRNANKINAVQNQRKSNATFQVNNLHSSSFSNEENLRETIENNASSQIIAKASKKKCFPGTAGLRRSGRTRIAPLEVWRNERPFYRIENGLHHLIKIDPGTKEDESSRKAIIDRQATIKNKKSFKNVKSPKFKLNDAVSKKVITLPLLKRFSCIPWEENLDKSGSYRVKKVIQTSNSNFGYIEIGGGKKKPLQYLPSEDIYLCLLQGKLKALVQDNEVTLEEKDTLAIPRAVPYSLENTGSRKALLVFTVGRYKYLENMYK